MKLKPQVAMGQGMPSAGTKVCHAIGMNRWNSRTGTEMITVTFVILKDVAAKGDEGMFFRNNFAITANAVHRLQQYAHSVGYTEMFDTDSDEDILKIMSNGYVYAKLREKSYNGKTGIDVNSFSRYSDEVPDDWNEMVNKAEDIHVQQEERRAAYRNDGPSNNRSTAVHSEEVPF